MPASYFVIAQRKAAVCFDGRDFRWQLHPERTHLKRLIIALLIIGAAAFGLQRFQQARNPKVIANPVYAEVRIRGDFPIGQVELVTFVKAVDQQDCQKGIHILEGAMTPEIQSRCPTCAVAKSECKPDLPLRYAKLFDNEPSSVTYVSFARGNRTERETRMVIWGVTAAQSDQLCDALVPGYQKKVKGMVKCIRPM